MRRLLSLSIVLLCVLLGPAADDDRGVLPAGADGKPLNLDFETGTLKDWTATGTAFQGQPIKGDTVHPRRGVRQPVTRRAGRSSRGSSPAAC